MEKSDFPRKFRAVLFDLDGTLMDTDDHLVERVGRVFRFFRLRKEEERARRLVMWAETPVNGLITFFDRVGMDRFVMALFHRKRKLTVPARLFPPIIEGVAEMVKQLSRDFRIGLVTTNRKADAEAFLEENGIREFFDVVADRISTKRLKPHPDPILFAARELGVTPGECIMVGDTTPDIKAAVAAGAFPVGVLCGFGIRRELERAGAEVILENTARLWEWLFPESAELPENHNPTVAE